MATYSQILGTGSYLPVKIVTNYDLEKMLDTSHDWIVERTGIRQRHIAAEHETALMMAECATHQALTAADITPSHIDMIIVATTTPEKLYPSTACLLQQRLGVAGCPAFDLNSTACAGFIYAFSIADQYIRSGTVKTVLVIGSEVMSRVVDWQDRATCVLFGDGAGAVILGAQNKPGVLSTHLHADGTYGDVLAVPIGVGKPVAQYTYMTMKGNQLFKIAVNILGQLFDETLTVNGIHKSEVDWLVPHQANMRIIHGMAKKLAMPLDRVAITLDEQGNTSAASIPLALDKAVRDGRIQRGQLLLLEGFGGGLTWGSALVRY
ncbi:MAG: 3-oxoacyl-ACP synthase [Gammaproteobacteria bacterium RIFCSPHIGHO2_12_FULL_41_20]|nr:MAG: 3-oxoacyl-ACP synthase [Gammaproteobacteria bacterium RIFCSPHIGHO2_12_FULL_41_20]